MLLVDDNTKKIADEVLGLTKLGVTEVWNKIQQAAPELWKLVVRQKVIEGVELAIGAFIALIVFIVVLKVVPKWIKEDDTDAGWVTLFVVGGGSLITFIVCLVNAIDLLGNPAYWALKDILDMVRR